MVSKWRNKNDEGGFLFSSPITLVYRKEAAFSGFLPQPKHGVKVLVINHNHDALAPTYMLGLCETTKRLDENFFRWQI